MSLSHLILPLVSVTEKAAISCSTLIGSGDRKKADKLATEAMRKEFNHLPISGTIVIGEGERDEAPMLYIGEKVGKGGQEIDISVDPLEGTNLCAENQPGAITVLGVGPKGSLVHAPDTYMYKIVVGPRVKEKISLKNSTEKNLKIIAKAYGIPMNKVQVIVMQRKRHEKLVAEIRKIGARIKFISDGDVFGAINAMMTEETDIHALIGIGAAPEGVITACAVRALGGQMEGKLMPYDENMEHIQEDVVKRMKQMGIKDINKIYTAAELAKGDDLLFVATGVTSGNILRGVRHTDTYIETESIIFSSKNKTTHKILTKHAL